MKALYVGSFDPFTKGHLEVLTQASEVYDVTVGIAENLNKKRTFSIANQLKVLVDLGYTAVYLGDSLTTDYMDLNDINVLIRGLRNTSDYLYEEQLYQMYKLLKPNIKVVYYRTDSPISSTIIRELKSRNKDFKNFLP